MTKKGRKLILVRNDLLEQAIKITAKEGRTLFSFTNEIFEHAIKAYNMKATLKDVIEYYKLMNVCKGLGYTPVPYEIFMKMAKKLYEKERKKMLEEWYEFGFWAGSYFEAKYNENLIETVKSFLQSTLWNIDELCVDLKDNEIDLKCFSKNLTPEYTGMLAKFIEGLFNSLGYVVKSNKRLRGIIIFKLRPKKEENSEIKLSVEN